VFALEVQDNEVRDQDNEVRDEERGVPE